MSEDRYRGSWLSRFLSACVEGATRHAWLVVLGSLLLSAAALYYTLSALTINTDTDAMINAHLPFRQDYAAYNQAFPQLSDNFVIVVEGSVPEEVDQAAAVLATRLTDMPVFKSVFSPGQGAFFQKNGLLFLDTKDLEKLIDQLSAAQPLLSPLAARPTLDNLFTQLANALNQARAHGAPLDNFVPVLNGLATTADARAQGQPAILSWQNLVRGAKAASVNSYKRFVIVQPRQDRTQIQPAKAALAAAHGIAGELAAAYPGVKLNFTGKIALNNEELKSVRDGAVSASLLSLLAVTLILALGVRSFRFVLAGLIALLIGLVWTAGFAVAAIGYLNIVSVAFAVLFIGIGVDFAIHMILRYQEERARGGDHVPAMRITGATAGKAVALGAPTTALGFFAFTPTDYHGLAQLGVISGTGIFFAVVTSLTVLPALITLMPVQVKPHDAERSRGTIAFLSARAGALIGAGVIVTVVALLAVPSAGFDFDPIRLKDPESPSVVTYLELARDGSTTPYTVNVLVPDNAEANVLKDKLKALPEVARVVSVDSYVPRDQEKKLAMLADASLILGDLGATSASPPAPDPTAEASSYAVLQSALMATATDVPGTVGAAAANLSRALKRYESARRTDPQRFADLRQAYVGALPPMLASLTAGLGAEAVTRASLPTDLRERYIAPDGRMRLEVFPKGNASDQATLKRFVEAVGAVAPNETGSAVQVVRAGEVIVASMREATLLAIAVITAFLFLILRRPRDVVLVILPVAIATLATTAATVWFNVPFNFANVIALPLIIGLGVTGGTQIVIRARQDSRAADLFETNTPKAVILSALTTIAAFATLAISPHRGTASMGILLSVGLTFMMLTTLIILPATLAYLQRRAEQRSRAP